MHVKRMGGKGGVMRNNATTSWGKQKANRRWEVEVAVKRGGRWRWCVKRQGRAKRMAR